MTAAQPPARAAPSGKKRLFLLVALALGLIVGAIVWGAEEAVKRDDFSTAVFDAQFDGLSAAAWTADPTYSQEFVAAFAAVAGVLPSAVAVASVAASGSGLKPSA